ncbi:MAG: NusG domain II-containing protein [Bacillota bacterium]|nr:NusG domain II-containing protein [Bacillota bacterium]
MKKYFTVVDLCVVFIIAIICSAGAFVSAHMASSEHKTIIIEVEGKVFARYSMDNLPEKPREINIKTKYGKNILSISREGAYMVYSDCLNQIDVKQGKIFKVGEALVCAPHKLVVYIDGKNELDAVSG